MIEMKRAALLFAGLFLLCLAPAQARAQTRAAVAVELTHARTDHQDLGRMGGATLRVGFGHWELGLTSVKGTTRRFDTPCGGFIMPGEVGCEYQWLDVRGGLVAAQIGRVFSAFENFPVELQWVPHLSGGIASVDKFGAEGSRGAYSTEVVVGIGSRFGASVRPLAAYPLRVVVGIEPAARMPIGPTLIDAYQPIQELVVSTHYALGIALHW